MTSLWLQSAFNETQGKPRKLRREDAQMLVLSRGKDQVVILAWDSKTERYDAVSAGGSPEDQETAKAIALHLLKQCRSSSKPKRASSRSPTETI